MIIEPQDFALQRGMPALAKCFERAADGGPREQRSFALTLLIGAELGFQIGRVTEEEEMRSWRQGFDILRKLSDEGDIWSMRSTATCLAAGIGTEQDFPGARRLLEAIRQRVDIGDRADDMRPDVVDALEKFVSRLQHYPGERFKPELPDYGL